MAGQELTMVTMLPREETRVTPTLSSWTIITHFRDKKDEQPASGRFVMEYRT